VMPSALVTGATGFLGRALTRLLSEEGWEVHALVRPQSDALIVRQLRSTCRAHVFDGSTVELLQILDDVRPEAVFHLASLFLREHEPEDVEDLIRSNVLFATQLAEAMVRTSCLRLVNAGTSWQHYHGEGYRPVNLYAATKQAFEDILLYYRDACGLSSITLKLFDTYGPGDTRRKVLDVLIQAAGSGEAIAMSAGEEVVDLTHAEDVARAFLRAAQMLMAADMPVSESYFVSSERFAVRDLVEVVQEATGRKIDARLGERGYPARQVMVPADPGSRALPGWERRFSVAGYLRTLDKRRPS
jgi:nucleoside-diphosphate-sugar epimerase